MSDHDGQATAVSIIARLRSWGAPWYRRCSSARGTSRASRPRCARSSSSTSATGWCFDDPGPGRRSSGSRARSCGSRATTTATSCATWTRSPASSPGGCEPRGRRPWASPTCSRPPVPPVDADNAYETTHYWSAYPDATTRDVGRALRVLAAVERTALGRRRHLPRRVRAPWHASSPTPRAISDGHAAEHPHRRARRPRRRPPVDHRGDPARDDSPFATVAGTHNGRFAWSDARGRLASRRRCSCAPPRSTGRSDEWLPDLRACARADADAIWSHCAGWPRPRDGASSTAWLTVCMPRPRVRHVGRARRRHRRRARHPCAARATRAPDARASTRPRCSPPTARRSPDDPGSCAGSEALTLAASCRARCRATCCVRTGTKSSTHLFVSFGSADSGRAPRSRELVPR